MIRRIGGGKRLIDAVWLWFGTCAWRRRASFDRLVGAGEQRRWNLEAERWAVLRLIVPMNA
jgi:hypothetical protein